MSHKQPDDRLSVDAVQEQKDPWHWAAELLTPWGKLEEEDYDFRCWMEGVSEDLLNAGCIYEYARESHTFRWLLVLNHTPKRERFWSGILVQSEGRAVGQISLEERKRIVSEMWRERIGLEKWLDTFADELIANKSFAKVYCTSRPKVEDSLKELPGDNLYPKAVESPGRYINVPGIQEVVIDWRHFTNKEIAAEIALKRPKTEPEPNRSGRQPESKTCLKDLSVMRIWKRYADPWKRLKLVAEACGYKVCKDELAEYKSRRDRFLPKEPMSNKAQAQMSRARGRSLSLFQCWFPWGKPWNY